MTYQMTLLYHKVNYSRVPINAIAFYNNMISLGDLILNGKYNVSCIN